MLLDRQTPGRPALRGLKILRRSFPTASAGRLPTLRLVLCFAALFHAAIARPEQLDPAVANLDKAVKQQAERLAQVPALESPPATQGLNLTWLALGVLGGILALRQGLRFLERRSTKGESMLPTSDELAFQSFATQPAIARWLEQLVTDARHPRCTKGASSTDADIQAPAANSHIRFFQSAPLESARIQGLFAEARQSTDALARQQAFGDLAGRLRSLCYGAREAGLRPVSQIASALEELLKQLARADSGVSPSALRTGAGGLDVLHEMCIAGSALALAIDDPVRLLAVDDDAVSRLTLSLALRRVFPEPDLAPDGEAGLRLAAGRRYDAIFLDIEMPGMDGFELCSRIHETSTNATAPVVFVTRHSDFDSRAKAALSGGLDLVGKPFFPSEVTVKALTVVFRSRFSLRATSRGDQRAPMPEPEPDDAVLA